MDSRNLYVNFLIITKPKNLNNFKRLYYKTDKEQIMQILHHLNIKYLLSLYKKAIHAQHVTLAWTWDYPTEDDMKTAYISVYQMVNYDGCQFQALVKTLKDELKRREKIGEVISENYTLPNGRTFKMKWQINKDYKKIIKLMRIYLIPYALTYEENEREIKKKTFGLEPIDAPSFWYLHGALQHEFIFDKAYMYVDWETYKSDIVETKDERNYLVSGIYDVEVEGYDNPCKAFMWQSEEDGITLLRGLVVDPTIEEDLKDAQKKYEEKPFML